MRSDEWMRISKSSFYITFYNLKFHHPPTRHSFLILRKKNRSNEDMFFQKEFYRDQQCCTLKKNRDSVHQDTKKG